MGQVSDNKVSKWAEPLRMAACSVRVGAIARVQKSRPGIRILRRKFQDFCAAVSWLACVTGSPCWVLFLDPIRSRKVVNSVLDLDIFRTAVSCQKFCHSVK
jgi:hypothetical protein